MTATENQIWRLIHNYWQVPLAPGRRLAHLMAASPCARVQDVRWHLGVATDLERVFREVLTPRFVMQMLRDLWAVGALAEDDCRAIEEAVLQCVDKAGQWRPREE
jgi:hypothetical protein